MIGVEEAKDAARTLKQFCDEQESCKKCTFGVSQKVGRSSEIFHCGVCYPANQDWKGDPDEGDT